MNERGLSGSSPTTKSLKLGFRCFFRLDPALSFEDEAAGGSALSSVIACAEPSSRAIAPSWSIEMLAHISYCSYRTYRRVHPYQPTNLPAPQIHELQC